MYWQPPSSQLSNESGCHYRAGLIQHSDHGSNYTSSDYQTRLTEIGARIHTADPQENGIAESFNKTVSYKKLFLPALDRCQAK
jgi:transposase InsO family protein